MIPIKNVDIHVPVIIGTLLLGENPLTYEPCHSLVTFQKHANSKQAPSLATMHLE